MIIRLDVYIYDYLVKRNLHTSAKAFQAEGKVLLDPVGKLLLSISQLTLAWGWLDARKYSLHIRKY